MARQNRNTPGTVAGFVWQSTPRGAYLLMDHTFHIIGELNSCYVAADCTYRYTLTVYGIARSGMPYPAIVVEQTIELGAEDLHSAGVAACAYAALHHPPTEYKR